MTEDVLRNVSRETLSRLDLYTDLLRTWNPKINLVARSTMDSAWSRHVLDSAQAFPLIPPEARTLVDLGSGGGFPGMVFAILAADALPELRVTLVESDQRKAAFLAAVARQTGVSVGVVAERIEALAPVGADVVSARALAPLNDLLSYAQRHMAPDGTAIFLKGSNHQKEIDDALANWRFSVQKTPSTTDPSAVILTVGGLSRA